MNTCKTCKHWKSVKSHAIVRVEEICAPRDQDTYDLMEMPFEVRQCTSPALVFRERTCESNGFSITDASDYFAILCTAEDFGCVRHEVTDAEKALIHPDFRSG